MYENTEFCTNKTLWPRGTLAAAPAKLELSMAGGRALTSTSVYFGSSDAVLRGRNFVVGRGDVSTAAVDEHVKR